MRVIVDVCGKQKNGHQNNGREHCSSENIIEIDQQAFLTVTEKICNEGRYPLLAMRILTHAITGIDTERKINISARHLSKKLNVHYDTVTKCLKFLREIGAMSLEKDKDPKTVAIYGKKTYCIHSSIARKAATNESVPDYTN